MEVTGMMEDFEVNFDDFPETETVHTVALASMIR